MRQALNERTESTKEKDEQPQKISLTRHTSMLSITSCLMWEGAITFDTYCYATFILQLTIWSIHPSTFQKTSLVGIEVELGRMKQCDYDMD